MLARRRGGYFDKYPLDHPEEALGPIIYSRLISSRVPWGYRYHAASENLPSESRCARAQNKWIVSRGFTPLHCAAQRGAVGVIKALLSHGVDTSSLTELGMSASGLALTSMYLKTDKDVSNAVLDLLGQEIPWRGRFIFECEGLCNSIHLQGCSCLV